MWVGNAMRGALAFLLLPLSLVPAVLRDPEDPQRGGAGRA